jgi:hypothetical protein
MRASSRWVKLVLATIPLSAASWARAQILPIPDTVLPDPSVVPGAVIVADSGATVLRAKLVTTHQITLDSPVTVAIGAIEATFPAGSVFKAWGKNPGSPQPAPGAGDGPYFCSEALSRHPRGVEIVMKDRAAKLKPWTRFCLIDKQGAGRMDAAFLYGPPDNTPPLLQTLTLAPYHEQKLIQAHPKDELRIIASRSRHFAPVKCLSGDISQNFVPFYDNHAPFVVTYADGKILQFSTKEDCTSGHLDMLGASLDLQGNDSTGKAIIRINSNFSQHYVTQVWADEPVPIYKGP